MKKIIKIIKWIIPRAYNSTLSRQCWRPRSSEVSLGILFRNYDLKKILKILVDNLGFVGFFMLTEIIFVITESMK